jgi:hypothetical protein
MSGIRDPRQCGRARPGPGQAPAAPHRYRDRCHCLRPGPVPAPAPPGRRIRPRPEPARSLKVCNFTSGVRTRTGFPGWGGSRARRCRRRWAGPR